MTQSRTSATLCAENDQDPWRLGHVGFDAARSEHEGTLYALANGTLGVRGGCEEAGGSGGCFLAQVHHRAPIEYHERFPGFAATTDTRLPVADGSAIGIVAAGRRLHPADSTCTRFERVLDLQTGLLRRRVRWTLEGAGTIELLVERVVPLGLPAALVIRFELRSIDFHGHVCLESSLDAERTAPGQGDDPRIGTGSGAGMRVISTRTSGSPAVVQTAPDDRIRVACSQQHRLLGRASPGAAARREGSTIIETFEADLEAGQSTGAEKYVAWAWDNESPDSDDAGLLAEVDARCDQAASLGFEALAADQAERLNAFWRGASVDIDGDPDALRALRINLFHLFQSSSRSADHGTAAKGLTGDGYEGHCFWDSESFMLPVLALVAPDLARAALEFRHRTLDRARHHAREMNHPRGALYPWRTITGDECSGHYPSGSAQYHINAAIAYAVRVYEASTGDAEFMAEAGVEILAETARIWIEAGHFNEHRESRFCICEVTGPDEYSALVDNNYYTNKMARAHLLHAVQAWQRLELDRPEAARDLAERIGLAPDELETWQRAGESMYLPWDDRLGIHPQADGFLDKPTWNFEREDRPQQPLLLNYHPLTLFRHQVCKQADVVQALVMDGLDVAPEVKQRCFDYYASITTHDSTLSATPFAILAAELGRAEPAMGWFDDTLRVDLDNLHGNSSHGVHLAAMAGSWQCLAYGFAGLRIDGSRLRFAPVMPARWRSWQLSITWRGRRIALGAEPDQAWFRLDSGKPLEIECHGKQLRLDSGRTIASGLPPSARWMLIETVRPIEAVIFDLDGVLTDTAEMHFQAWTKLADELGLPFNRITNRRLKGVDRMHSLEILLEGSEQHFSDDERRELAARKNGYYREALTTLSPEQLLPGAARVLGEVRAAGLRMGLASASRNASTILERLEISDFFDFIADPARVGEGKPHPAIFQAAANGLHTAPEACLGVEDAAAGIVAIKAAGMTALGIGDRQELPGADAVLDGLDQFRIETIPHAGTVQRETARREASGAIKTSNNTPSADLQGQDTTMTNGEGKTCNRIHRKD